MGYRRFELDLFWNSLTQSFQICPEQILGNITAKGAQLVSTTITTQDVTTILSSTSLVDAGITSTVLSTPTPATFSVNITAPIPVSNNYTCDIATDFQAVLSTIQDILMSTDNNLRTAGLFILNLNLNTLQLSQTNNTVDLSPRFNISLSMQINNTLGNWLYTPMHLHSDRNDINSTFLHDETANPIIDITAYYDIIINNVTKTASTPNGWPTTRHLFEINGLRLLVGFGTVNISSQEYDIDKDTNLVFPPGTFGGGDQLVPPSSVNISDNACRGPSGVVFGPHGEENFSSTALQGNLTFATSQDPFPSQPMSYNTIQDLVTCGLSPIIDSPMTLTNSGSLSPIDPIAGTVWSWLAPSQPTNVILPTNGTDEVWACAAMNADTGHWVVLDCNTQLNIACRVNQSLYNVFPPTRKLT